jgi:hypothetical protein
MIVEGSCHPILGRPEGRPPPHECALVTAKDRYEPTSLFQFNQSIRPSGNR